MSQENVEIVRRALEAWNTGDFETGLSLVDPNIDIEIAMGTPIDGTYRGHEGLTKFLTEFWREFETFGAELIECIPQGDDVVLGVHHHGRGRGSGADVEMSNWQVATVRHGRIVRWRNFRARGEALEAAGLSE